MASRSPPAMRPIRTSSEVVCIGRLSAHGFVAGGWVWVQAKRKKRFARTIGSAQEVSFASQVRLRKPNAAGLFGTHVRAPVRTVSLLHNPPPPTFSQS